MLPARRDQVRGAYDAALDDVDFCGRGTEVHDQDGCDAVAYRGADGAEYLYFVKINLERRGLRDRLIIFENVVVYGDEKDFIAGSLRRLFRLKAVEGAIFALFARNDEPVEGHFGDGYRNIFARLDGNHPLQLFGRYVRQINDRNEARRERY